jgi:hypothetical protein
LTNQEKIQYLKQYKRLDKKIDRLLEEKDKWRCRAEKITQTITDMPHGGDGENQRELAICKMVDCDREATRLIDAYVDLGREIKSCIDKVDNEDYRLLLSYRYIDGKTWEKISVLMNYDVEGKNIFKLHGKAITLLNVDTQQH